MRSAFFKIFAVVALLSSVASAQTVPTQWKKAVVSVESILRRYDQKQVHDLLQKQLNDLGKTISQHETFERRDALEGIKDTIHGTGILLSDGAKLYIVTTKRLVKATELLGVAHREVITDFLTVHLDASAKKTNDINLLNFVSIVPAGSPVVFSDDKTDLAIISLQQKNKKLIADYIKQNGGVGIPVQSIAKAGVTGINTADIAQLLKKLHVNEQNPAFNY